MKSRASGCYNELSVGRSSRMLPRSSEADFHQLDLLQHEVSHAEAGRLCDCMSLSRADKSMASRQCVSGHVAADVPCV